MLPVTEAERIRTPPGPLSVEIIYNVTAIKHVQVIRFKTRPGILELLLHAVLPLLQAVKQLREMDFPLPLCQNVSLGTVKSQQRHADGFKPLDAITWNDQTFTSSFNHHLKKKKKTAVTVEPFDATRYICITCAAAIRRHAPYIWNLLCLRSQSCATD